MPVCELRGSTPTCLFTVMMRCALVLACLLTGCGDRPGGGAVYASDAQDLTDVARPGGLADAASDAPAIEDDATDTPVSMIDNALWEPVAREDDPFYPADDAEVVPCTEDAFEWEVQGEEMWFSVETISCNYLTVRQPLQVDVAEGAQLRVRLWHFQILRAEGTYTHAIAVGASPDTLWETVLPVPTESGGLLPYELVPMPRGLTAGEPIYWHLRNHGQNSWHLIEVSAN